MYIVNILTFFFLICCVRTLQVSVARSLTEDDIVTFNSSDNTLCIESNAALLSTDPMKQTTTCKCQKDHVYYSLNAFDEPKCQNGNARNQGMVVFYTRTMLMPLTIKMSLTAAFVIFF